MEAFPRLYWHEDGRLALVVVNRNAPFEIHRSETSEEGGWVLLKVEQQAPNLHAIGAWIELRAGPGAQSRELTIVGGHASGLTGSDNFVLGVAKSMRKFG